MSFPRPAAIKPPKVRGVAVTIAGAALIAAFALGLTSCGKTVEPGNAGVKIRTLGTSAGVDPEPLPSGWHFRGIGERIVEFPVIQRTYSYTREPDERGPQNEEIAFADNTGLPMTADVAITLQVSPASAPNLYKTYRLSFDQLLDGPIRNDVRSAIMRRYCINLAGIENPSVPTIRPLRPKTATNRRSSSGCFEAQP